VLVWIAAEDLAMAMVMETRVMEIALVMETQMAQELQMTKNLMDMQAVTLEREMETEVDIMVTL
jgi:hypothetical protein